MTASGEVGAEELRVALVLNGGVSLAVWIGGVTHELDRLRRALSDEDGRIYRKAVEARGYRSVRIDVISGASAGGINGALLASAIQGGLRGRSRRLLHRGKSMRDLWIELGDLGALTRGARDPDPPSLLRGDEYMLEKLTDVLEDLLREDPPQEDAQHPLYLYLTATDLRAGRKVAFVTSGESVVERDHRVVFRFTAGANDHDEPPGLKADELADTLRLNRANALRLARAARASSSFPGAFPPHVARIRRRETGRPVERFLIDGGVLDNQPFTPVLNRIAGLKVGKRVRRVLLYVVPYVTESRKLPDGPPGLREVTGSSTLARDLPKLEALSRVVRDRQDGGAAEFAGVALVHEDRIADAARVLLPLYRKIQKDELARTAAQWERELPSVGGGTRGEDEITGADDDLIRPLDAPAGEELDRLIPEENDDVVFRRWSDPSDPPKWCWGLTKAERFAATALRWVATSEQSSQQQDDANLAREAASDVVEVAQRAARERRSRFRDRTGDNDAIERFVRSHDDIAADLREVDAAVRKMCDEVAKVVGLEPDAVFERLASAEVVANAAGNRRLPPAPFDFYRVSAKTRVLGREFDAVDEKLAGMRLMHFAAFLKRSWRAHDWMWGRLDATFWIAQMLRMDPAQLERLQLEILREELPAVAREVREDELAGFSSTSAESRWRRTHRIALEADGGQALGSAIEDDDVKQIFTDLTLGDDRLREESGSRAGVVTITRLVAVASRAFSGVASRDFPGPARALVSSTRTPASAAHSLAVTFARAPAVGLGLVIALAAIAVALASSGAAASVWLTPALVGIALTGAWSSYGWISSPPGFWRALILIATSAGLEAVIVAHGAPDRSTARVIWVASLLVSLVALALALAYFGSALKTGVLAEKIRLYLGAVLLLGLALLLGRVGVDHIDSLKTFHGQTGWEAWFAGRETLRWGVITVVALSVLVPLAEVASRLWSWLRRKLGF